MSLEDSGEMAEGQDSIERLGEDSSKEQESAFPKAAVIVAHPDDETLWAGGLILRHPNYQWFITALSRRSDPDRSPKFYRILERYNANGALADLEDGPEQNPLPLDTIQHQILNLLPACSYELLVTHAPTGEYTRHKRHEEVSRAVTDLWRTGTVSARALYLFAYKDNEGKSLPRAVEAAHRFDPLPEATCQEKYRLMTDIYGFQPGSWEARTTPRAEAFWCFESPAELESWLRETEGR